MLNTYLTKFSKRAKLLAVVLGIVGSFLWIVQSEASGVISGTVYVDYNMNGVNNSSGAAPNYAVDSGIGGVTVSAYDAAGVLRGTAVSGSTGAYVLNASGTGPYRIEFTNIPAGYYPSEVGANNASSVRIVPNGNSSAVDFGIVRPIEYCQNNPFIYTNVYTVGSGPFKSFARFPLNYADELDGRLNSVDPTNWTTAPSRTSVLDPDGFGDVNAVGATFGISYDSRNDRLFASSFLKRGARFGSLSGESTGAIYVVSNPGNSAPAATLYTDLNAIFGAGTAGANPHPSASTSDWTDDAATVPLVGKRGLGGLKLSADGTTLYTVNLNDRRLYAIPTSGTLNSTTIQRYNIPTTGLATSAGTCNANDVRPFALGRDRSGQIYVGAVCSAESETSDAKLHAYVWRFSGSIFTLVANNNLTFTRTARSGESATWQRWASISGPINRAAPWLTDIEFDGNDMILGIRDRYGDQVVMPDYLRGYGDNMRVCLNGANYVFESNGTCGSVTTPVPSGGNANSGNGGREYYYDLNGDGREEGSLGGLTQIPGFNHVLSSFYDPVTFNSAGTRVINYYTAGLQRYHNTLGTQLGAYDVYLDADPGNFGKAGGVGDTEAICLAAPLQIGNRVWNDTDGDGIQDSNENGLQNVALQLWADTNADTVVDTQIGSATSDSTGGYLFGGAGNANLSTYSCGTTNGSLDIPVNASSDDAYQNANGSMNSLSETEIRIGSSIDAAGVRFQNVSIPRGATITSSYIQFTSDDDVRNTGTPTVQIYGQANDNAPTFGSSNLNITNRPNTSAVTNWTIPNWGNNSESGANQRTPSINSIVQELVNRPGWNSGNAMVFKLIQTSGNTRRDAESIDGSTTGAARLVVNYTVANTCQYTLSPNTNYEVRVPAANFNSGQPLNAFSPTVANADTSANGVIRDSNGLSVSGNQVVAPVLTGGSGENNHTVDFGFRSGTTNSIGNRVWFDTNNNGIINSGEQGIGGLTVSLYLDANNDGRPDTPGSPLQTVVTDSLGYYRFDRLGTSNYIVCVDPVNFISGGRLERYRNVTSINTAPIDSAGASINAENGVNTAGPMNAIISEGIVSNNLGVNGATAPTSEPDIPTTGVFAGQGSLDSRADMTIDIGFYQMCLNGTLWNDTSSGGNNNGILNPGETGIPFIRVRVFDSSNAEVQVGPDGILGTSDDAIGGTATNSSGDYSLCGLPPGQYRVAVGNGGTSSTPTSLNPDDNIDSDDNGYPGTGQFAGLTVSNLVTLSPGNAGALNNNIISNAQGSTRNPTVDFGFIVAPSYVNLEKFEAYSDGSETVIEWSTALEFENLGFNVYRESNGKRELVNRGLIAGNALKSTANLVASGDRYMIRDHDPKSNAVYYLEDLEMSGKTTLHGPIFPRIKFSSLQPRSELFIEVDKFDRAPEREFVAETPNNETEGFHAAFTERQKQIAGMKGVKIIVDHDGLYTVSAAQLAASGFSGSSNRDYWQLFANGEEIPFGLNSDGSIEFFGSGNDKIWTAEKVYYLVEGESPGARLEPVKGDVPRTDRTPSSFDQTTILDERFTYFPAIRNGDDKNYFGSLVSNSAAVNKNLTVKDLAAEGNSRLTVRLQGLNTGSHLVNIVFNGIQLGTVEFAPEENRSISYDIPLNYVLEGTNTVQLQAVSAGADYSAIDSIALTYPRKFIAESNRLRFILPAGEAGLIDGFSDKEIELFEVDNGAARRRVPTYSESSADAFALRIAPENHEREILALSRTAFESPRRIVANEPSDWNAAKNSADLIIISYDQFAESAKNLADLRRTQNLETVVVSVSDIFDEFGFGEPSPLAIKEFLKNAVQVWKKSPRYVLLFGDTTFDPRGYQNYQVPDQVPTKYIDTTHQETTSDSWFADFDEDGIEDLAIGRLPVSNDSEAAHAVAKLAEYDRQAQRDMDNILLTDRGFENYSDALQSEMPSFATSTRIDRSQMSDSQMHQQVMTRLNEGPLLVTFNGHGAPSLMASQNVFRVEDVAQLNNSKYSTYLLMTCLNAYIPNPIFDSMAETLVKRQGGGAIAVWASSGTTYPDKQFEISRIFTRQIFNSPAGTLRIGDIVRSTKAASSDMNIKRTWTLIGDPTVFIK